MSDERFSDKYQTVSPHKRLFFFLSNNINLYKKQIFFIFLTVELIEW